MAQLVLLAIGIFLTTLAFPACADAGQVPSLCKNEYPSDRNIEWECHRVRKGESPESLFGPRWRDVLRYNRIDRRHVYPWARLKVPKRLEDVEYFSPVPDFYPEAQNEEKFILVDLTEQFLGAYEFGRLVFSAPIASGEEGNSTPAGEFRITAFDRRHQSSLYFIEKTRINYPMNYALRFLVNKKGISFWIHGRDLPGYPASHGCIGLYDEPMQKEFYNHPSDPVLEDARILYEWVISPLPDPGGFQILKNGPRIKIIGHAPN